jgi:hypothetical protein
LKEKLVRADSLGGRTFYGATNQAFISDDVLTSRNHNKQPALLEIFEEPPQPTLAESPLPPIDPIQDDNIIADEARGEERESWDSKITFLLATIG